MLHHLLNDERKIAHAFSCNIEHAVTTERPQFGKAARIFTRREDEDRKLLFGQGLHVPEYAAIVRGETGDEQIRNGLLNRLQCVAAALKNLHA